MDIKILNGSFEFALRTLAILVECATSMSEERIAIYSYYAIHLSDLREDGNSIHPDIPFRYTLYLRSKEVLTQAIVLLLNKGLIDIDTADNTLKYKCSETGEVLLSNISGEYKDRLLACVKTVDNQLQGKSDMELMQETLSHAHNWGANLNHELLFSYEE